MVGWWLLANWGGGGNWTPPLSLPNLQTHNFNTHSMSSWGTVQRTIDFLPFILHLTFLRYHRYFSWHRRSFLCVLELKSLLKWSIWYFGYLTPHRRKTFIKSRHFYSVIFSSKVQKVSSQIQKLFRTVWHVSKPGQFSLSSVNILRIMWTLSWKTLKSHQSHNWRY